MALPKLSPKQIRKLRKDKGWSQTDLSNAAGLGGPSVISNAERGLIGPIVEKKLREVLNV